ncbi:hypothetical protein [Limosilactobacillus sp.]|uniref:hypothetical protein n=1 Tax=Limosilactobacillus sp. TaxID=2773925 RepID=UPI003EFE8FFB
MRIKNLLIIIAIIAAILLVMRYFSQLRDTRRGYNVVSGSRVFVNWLLVIVLVGSLVGIGVTSFTGHKESAAPAPAKTSKSSSAVKPTADEDITLSFKKTARLNENGVAKVKFLISPQTKVVIKGHKSGIVVATFKPSKTDSTVNRSFTFDTVGTYDITASRGNKKVVKHLKIKDSATKDSSSSSYSAISSISSSASSSSTASSQDSSGSTTSSDNGENSTSSAVTSRSTNGGTTGGSYRSYRGNSSVTRSNGSANTGVANESANTGQQSPSAENGTLSDQP